MTIRKILVFILCLFTVSSIFSCKKWKYDNEVIKGVLINDATEQPMSGEEVVLIQQKNSGCGLLSSCPEASKTLSVIKTDVYGCFNFGEIELHKKNYNYYVMYLQKNNESYYNMRRAIDTISNNNYQNLAIGIAPTINSLIIKLNILSDTNADDSIYATITNYYQKKINPSSYKPTNIAATINSPFYTPYTIYNIDNQYSMGNYFIKSTKIKSGIRTIKYDTLFVNRDEDKIYYLDF